mgnify:CR=1 FL=1
MDEPEKGTDVTALDPSLSPGRPARPGPTPRLVDEARRAILARPEAVALGAVVLFALLVRVVSLGSIPANVTADEADNLQVVYHIREGRGQPGLFELDWKPAPAFSVYLIAGFMYVFGWSIEGMRMASALLATLAIVPFYFVARERLSAAASLVAAFLLSTGLWHLHFSRSGWENVQTGLFAMMAAWCLSLGLRGRGVVYYGLAGFWCSLGLYGYFAGRAILASLLAYLPFAVWERRSEARRVLAGYGVLLLVCAATFAPQAPSIIRNWDHFNSRTRTVAITSAQLPYLGATTMPEVVLGQVQRTVRAFLLLDGAVVNNSRYFPVGKPIFDPLAGGLFLVGLAAGLAAWRRIALWWCLTLVPLGFTQVLSMGTPDLARAVGVAPAMYLFVGHGFDRLAPRPGSWRRVLQLAVVLLLPWAAYSNLADYFAWMARPETVAARHPAVEASEFEVWQALQIKAAAAGQWGFSAGQWQEIRKQLGLRSPGAAATRPTTVHPSAVQATPIPHMATFEGIVGPPELFVEPRSVASDAAGHLYVVDAARRQVVKLDADGRPSLYWGRQGRGDGEFLLPWDVAVDGSGSVYVLDADAQQVQRFDAQGGFQGRFLARAALYRPRGLCVDNSGVVYVADTGGNRIVKMAPTGEVLAFFGAGSGEVTLNQPTDVAVDAGGNVYVVEPDSRRLQKLDAEGRYLLEWEVSPGDTLDAPHLAVVADRLLVSDPHLRRVSVYSLDGALVGFWGGPGSDEGQFGVPMGLAADSRGYVHVADVRNARVQRFRLKE